MQLCLPAHHCRPILAKLLRYFRIYKNTSLLAVPVSMWEIIITVLVILAVEVVCEF